MTTAVQHSHSSLSTPDVELCRQIEKRFGTSYYLATRFLPREKRYATYALYAFFRLPDEIVDTEQGLSAQQKRQKLSEFRLEWERAFKENTEPAHPVLRATLWAHKRYGIPYEYSGIFLDAMEMDIDTARYATYKDLVKYMYGSASAVGLMMSYVIGFRGGEQTLSKARALGEAMQLTNFLRDIGEDYRDRARIYIPEEDLAKFGLADDDVKNALQSGPSEKIIRLLKFEIERARGLYRGADEGIPFLHRDGRYAVRLASRLYEAILSEIENNQYDVFRKRARTSALRKLRIAVEALLG